MRKWIEYLGENEVMLNDFEAGIVEREGQLYSKMHESLIKGDTHAAMIAAAELNTYMNLRKSVLNAIKVGRENHIKEQTN